MERIIQREQHDCGVACVAMLIQRHASQSAATSYDAALSVMFGEAKPRITSVMEIRRSLRHFGIEIGGRSVRFTPDQPKKMGLSFDALITTEQRNDLRWHWMVWDSHGQRLLDPLPEPYTRPRISHYIKLLQK